MLHYWRPSILCLETAGGFQQIAGAPSRDIKKVSKVDMLRSGVSGKAQRGTVGRADTLRSHNLGSAVPRTAEAVTCCSEAGGEVWGGGNQVCRHGDPEVLTPMEGC
ncbi:hypothetical protein SKAU_G00322340 [Synaphobranchus kaupii]|uniref:Uncharacterized protein n=1 Tax=Synaphobranchus kaupii TaxID=118154 RepID=A0A9Q1EP27_SYNKA|nr:hypothetical protein SKAU_G00322340 [Synaphobranchus kaupii]